VADPSFTTADIKHLRPGQAAKVQVAGCEIGSIGRLSDEIASQYKFRQPVYLAEVDLGRLLELPGRELSYKPLSRYPGVTRDVSLLAKRSVPFADIALAVKEQGFELCRSVEFVDVYEGKGLAADERSITIRLEYRSDEKTLLEEEVEPVHRQIVAILEQKLGVKQRV
jgi:phenylalanyl-tRNA synthetase beta chain